VCYTTTFISSYHPVGDLELDTLHVSTCRVFLISGVAKDTPLALAESNTQLGDLHDMLQVLTERIEEMINFRFGGDIEIKISDLKNLRLLVAGGTEENEKYRER
jgi:hypothetical protein